MTGETLTRSWYILAEKFSAKCFTDPVDPLYAKVCISPFESYD
ncbi:MAG: hypothetical protein AAB308_03620 [Nitrospirota bacterium]